MALAKQFYSSFKSYNGWDYYLEIWVEGYSGSASEISIGAGGPVITYGTDEQDRFSPILSSKLELPFMVTNTTQDAFIKNIRENFNEQDVYIHLYRASSSGYSSVAPLWSGFVLMDLSASPDLYYPYPVTLTAVDGLSLLKEIDFSKSGTAGSYTDADMYSSNGRFTYWLKEILLKSGASTTTQGSTQDYKFTTAINWFNSVMPTITQSTDPFYQTKCNTKMFFSKDADENFTVVNCYDVLKNLLKHWGARIIYWKHVFYIVQIQEYNTAESGTYANPDNIDTRTYTKTGAFDSSSDNLGDSYWTRYNLLIDDVTGGIQKLAGSQFNYLPQLKRTQAKFIDYGNKNYFGGLPYDLTTGQTDVIYQDTISDVSVDGSMILIIPLDVTMNVAYNGTLAMSLAFRMYITDGSTTYYLRYDPSNTPKYYWENATTANLNSKKTVWRSNLDNIVGTQTKVGFHEQIEFKDVSGSALTLTGDWDIYTDIDNWGANSGSFKFVYNFAGLLNFSTLYAPSASTIYWTNTLNPNYQTPLNPSVIGQTNQPTAYNPNYSLNPTTSNSIVSYTSQLNINPFEGKLLIVNASASGALYGSFVSVSPNPTTKDSEIVDFGDLIWGDTLLASSEGSLKVWNGSSFVKSNVIGTWGLGSTSGTNSFTEMLLSEYLYGQTKVIESPSMRLVIGETNKNQNDGSGSRPNYINPIGRLKGYSATGTTPYYIFKSGSFHLLKDEVDYQGYQIIRDTQSITKTDDIIIGPDILQDKTNKIGQKTPQTNTLVNKLTQNSYITTVSAIKSAFGNDVAVNGIFATDTGWTKGTGWSISSNKAIFSPTGSTSDIKQDTLTNALTYKIIVTLTLSAGGLSVKAGSSGNSTVLSASGTYEVFSTCAGSTDVIFEASAAFEGYIEKVVVQQQVPVTSININAIGTAVFKTNDVLNVADVDGDEVNEFTVSADQGASDTSISVTSKLITEDILEGSIILVNQNDLAAQYQNKTKGTVGGFDITATSIDSGSVAISSYIDDDSFGTASATSLATSESIKAYVDTQVGSADTLQEVTDNGNTTTNSVTIGSSSSPSYTLDVYGDVQFKDTSENVRLYLTSNNAYNSIIYLGDNNSGTIGRIQYVNASNSLGFYTNASEAMRITSTGQLLIGTTSTSTSQKLQVDGTAKFTDQVTIPATPVASTDAASKSYVDTQVGSADTLQEVTDNGNTTTNSVNIGSATTPTKKLTVTTSTSSDGILGITTDGSDWLKILNTNSTTFPVGQLYLYYGSNVVANITALSNEMRLSGGYTTGGKIVFRTATTERMRLTSTGLGIGTSSPSSLLHLKGADPFIQLEGVGGSNQGITFNNSKTFKLVDTSNNIYFSVLNDGSGADTVINSRSGGDILFQANASEKMRLTSTGLGIGTTNPNMPISIENSTDFLAYFKSTDNKAYIGISDDDTNVYVSAENSRMSLGFDTGVSVNNINILSNGNTGYGTVTPSEKIHVVGDALITGDSHADTFKPAVSGNPIKFKNFGSTELARITDGGNFGINQVNPVYKLDVAGNVGIRGGGQTTHQLFLNNGNVLISGDFNNQLFLKANDTGYIGLYTGGSEKARITNGGNLLIGTTTDSGFKLNVSGSITTAGGSANITAPRHIVADSNAMIYRNNDNLTLLTYQSKNITFMPNNSESVRFLANGNVLIGTTTDSGEKLEVAGSIKAGNLKIQNANGGRIGFNRNTTNGAIYNNSYGAFQLQNNGTGFFEIQSYNSSGTYQSSFSIKENGNVGIGTTNSNRQLQVKKTTGTASIAITSSNTGTAQLELGGTSDNDIAGVTYNGNTSMLSLKTNNTGQLYVTNGGNVLIGTTTDVGVPLYVNGVIRAVGGGIQAAQDYGFTLNDESGSNRYGLKFGAAGSVGGSNLLMLTNRSFNSATGGGEVAIGGNTNTSGVSEVEIARFIPRVTATSGTQKKVSLDAVLELTEQTAPANPASGESIIWMDSESGDLKVKINYGGTTVTRTLAAFEG